MKWLYRRLTFRHSSVRTTHYFCETTTMVKRPCCRFQQQQHRFLCCFLHDECIATQESCKCWNFVIIINFDIINSPDCFFPLPLLVFRLFCVFACNFLFFLSHFACAMCLCHFLSLSNFLLPPVALPPVVVLFFFLIVDYRSYKITSNNGLEKNSRIEKYS